MDNDRLRRGKLSTHAKFGESTAILAGNSLLTIAFEILSHPTLKIDYSGSTKKAGKKTRKDSKKGKATLISLLGYKNTVKYGDKVKLDILNKIRKFGNKKLKGFTIFVNIESAKKTLGLGKV